MELQNGTDLQWATKDQVNDKPCLATLPEELQLQILENVGTKTAPSERKARHEPTFELTISETRDLKTMSCVSKHWRRLTLPLLFRFIRLRLAGAEGVDPWPSCSVCSNDALSEESERVRTGNAEEYHDMQNSNDRRHRGVIEFMTTYLPKALEVGPGFVLQPYKDFLQSFRCLRDLYHSTDDLIDFLVWNTLEGSVESVTVYGEGFKDLIMSSDAPQAFRYAIDDMWSRLLATVDPRRVVVLAPPRELAILVGCRIDGVEHEWAFGDMDYHLLELSSRSIEDTSSLAGKDLEGGLDDGVLEGTEYVASTSILWKRSWTRIHLNEGSFLKAYGTYEYFERGPPSIIVSIREFLVILLSPVLSHINDAHLGRELSRAFSTVKTFAYTAIFPFNADNFAFLVGAVEVMDLQLSPDPQSGILDDKTRVGKADLTDCWSELSRIYKTCQTMLCRERIQDRPIRRFIASDYRYPACVEELKDVLDRMGEDPKWTHSGDGVFRRNDVEEDGEVPVAADE